MAYGNGHTVSYTYDNFGNASTISYNNVTAVKNFSDASGNIIRTDDLLTNLEHRVSYDSTGRLISKDVLDLTKTDTYDKWLRSVEYDFDENNNLTKLALASKNGSNVTTHSYKNDEGECKDNLPTVTTLQNGKEVTYTHDAYGRLTRKDLNTSNHLIYTYEYMDSEREGDYTTTKIGTESIGSNKYRYTYDAYGNIKRIYSVTSEDDPGTLLHLYMYDSANQLTTDMDAEFDRIIDYSYDEAGNIVQKKVSAWDGNVSTVVRGEEISTDTYSYTDSTWKDLLTSYNGQTITYDAIGNPLSYRDGITLTWQNGRELATLTKDGNTISYTYDSNGIRTQKNNGGTVTKYFYDESNNLISLMQGDTQLVFYYDADGQADSFVVYSGDTETRYYYVKNLQGDVTKIMSADGTIVANYYYDAYGKLLSTTNAEGVEITDTTSVAFLNPLRYRGYVYDSDTGLYYLQSRYYDPETCRFVNADVYVDTGTGVLGTNMFAYCDNSPINLIDKSGEAAINVIFAVVGGVVGWLLGDFVAKKLGYYSGWMYWTIRTGVVLGGVVIGWFAGSLMTKIMATYLKNNPAVIFKITKKLGTSAFHSAMKILGINPFLLAMDSSKFIAIARLLNSKTITISYEWAIKLYSKAKSLGFKIALDEPHNGYSWHIHLSGANGKLSNLHIQIVKKAWNYISKL